VTQNLKDKSILTDEEHKEIFLKLSQFKEALNGKDSILGKRPNFFSQDYQETKSLIDAFKRYKIYIQKVSMEIDFEKQK
jgi:predicted double-glycine peptidase